MLARALRSQRHAGRDRVWLWAQRSFSAATENDACTSTLGAFPTLHIETPLVHSEVLSRQLSAEVYLKMDCLQPTGSFKMRGIGATVREQAARGARRVVSSSGGNAGMAAAHAARRLGLPATVVVPTTTEASVCQRLRDLGAEVVVHGEAWDEANALAAEVADRERGALVHPFDDASTWRGHATMVEELARQLPRAPDAIVAVVGGGGLLMGILEGLRQVGWESSTRVVACETEGAASMARSLEAGSLVTLPQIRSVATSLGAKTVSRTVFERCRELGPERVCTFVMSDAAAVSACARFARDHRVLVEPACGAGLSAVYDRSPALADARLVVVEVCGGAKVDLGLLQTWMKDLGVENI